FKRPNRKSKNKLNDGRNNELNDGRERDAITPNISNDGVGSQSTNTAMRNQSNNRRSNKKRFPNNENDQNEDQDHIATTQLDSNFLSHEDNFHSSESSALATGRGEFQRPNMRKNNKLNDNGNNKLNEERESFAITSCETSETYPNNEDSSQSTYTLVHDGSNNKRSKKGKKPPNNGNNDLNEDRDHIVNEQLDTYSNTLNYEDDSHFTENSLSSDNNLSPSTRDISGQEDYGQNSNKVLSLRKNVALILQHDDNENFNPQFSETDANQDVNFEESMDSIDKTKFSKQKGKKKFTSSQSEQSVQQKIFDMGVEHEDLKHDDSIQSNINDTGKSVQQDSVQDGKSTSQSSGITTIAKLIEKVLPKENDDDVIIVFHVHMPKINEIGTPCVVGNITELGEWEKLTIKLTEKKISGHPTSCWESKPVRIPLAQFEKKVIKYKYAIKEKGRKNKNKPLLREGGDDRILEAGGGDKYEIWEEKGSRVSFPPEIKDVYLVKIIYDSVTLENLKEKIMKYEKIMNRYPKSTKAATTIDFIMNSFLEDKSLEKRLFLCVLLGYYVKERDSQYYSLPREFQSSLVFDTLQNITAETFPSDTYKILTLAIPLLVRHNCMVVSLDWLKIFGVASFIDPKYEFIDYISDFYYNEKIMPNFFKSFNDLVTPVICTIEDKEIYAKIIKWLFRQCSTMKFFVTVWQDIIIHSDEIDELLQQSLVERVRYILSRNVLSCIHLHNCYSDLPEQLKIMFIEIFRDRSLHLLSAKQYQQWDRDHLDAILKLLINDQIQWPLEDYFKVLDTVSQCVDLGLLTKFHELLKFGFNTFKEIDESKLSILCKQWYRNLLDRASNFSNLDTKNDYRDKFAFMAFSHISKVYPYIGKIPVWQTLLEIAVNRVKHTSENIIFSTVDKVVEKLEAPLVVEAFIAMVKDKLNSSMCIADNQLMAKIKLICNCSTDELKVPTRSSEDILCHIMTRLQSTFDSQTFSENFHLSLLNSGNFWIQVLKATGSVDKLHSHPQINEVRNAISHLTEILSEESISISLLQELLNKDDNFLLTYFGFAIMKEGLPSINKDILTNIREKYRIYGLGLDYLNSFYTEFCPQSIVFDVKEYIDDIYEMHQRKNTTTLKDTSLNDYWGMHTDILSIAEDLYKYRKSQTFKNFEIMPKIHESYRRWCMTYSKWETEKFSYAKILWNKVPDITVELDLMDGILKLERNPKLMRTLTDISK
ncbi:4922_t:CDS:2, partial [Racocetra persica]